MHGQCERARRWTSAELDGELSSFERALLHDHLDRCGECRAFNDAVGGQTAALRAAPLEPFEGESTAVASTSVSATVASRALAKASAGRVSPDGAGRDCT